MKALITGITGFVGSHLAEYLVCRENIEVYGIKRWRSPLSGLAGILDDVHLIDCDLRDANSVNQVIAMVRPDCVYPLAAQSYVPVSYTAPVDTFETNASGTINLLEAIHHARIAPNIHISS